MIKTLLKWASGRKDATLRTRAEMTDEEVRDAIKAIEWGSNGPRATLEMILDAAQNALEEATRPNLTNEQRQYSAGYAAGLLALSREMLRKR